MTGELSNYSYFWSRPRWHWANNRNAARSMLPTPNLSSPPWIGISPKLSSSPPLMMMMMMMGLMKRDASASSPTPWPALTPSIATSALLSWPSLYWRNKTISISRFFSKGGRLRNLFREITNWLTRAKIRIAFSFLANRHYRSEFRA